VSRAQALQDGAFNLRSQSERGWWERAQIGVDLLSTIAGVEAAMRIADIGCGDRKLAQALAERGLACVYTGFDLLPQDDLVQAFDIERDVLPQRVDAAVLLGVSEYLGDLQRALARQRGRCDWLLASHVLRTVRSPGPERLAELGWRNHLARDDFVALVERAGYGIVAERVTPDTKTLVVLCTSAPAGR
jgi:hypothetical protein